MKSIVLIIIIGILFTFTLFANIDLFVEKELLSKWYAYYILTCIICVFILLSNSKLYFKLDKISTFLILLILYIFIRGLFSNLVNISIINPLVFILVYFLFKFLSFEIKQIDMIVVLVCFFQAIYGFLQYFGLVYSNVILGVSGSFDNPAGFAACMVIGFSFSLFFIHKTHKYKYYGLFCLLVFGLAVIISKSRTGVLSVAITILAYLYLNCKILLSKKMILFAMLSLVFIIVFTGGLFLLNENSSIGRLFIWRNSISMISENLFFGNGSGFFQENYMFYQADFFEKYSKHKYLNIGGNVNHPFNELIYFIIEYGVIGLCLLFFIFFNLKNSIFKVNNKYLLPLISIGVFGFFSYPFRYPFVIIIVAYCFSVISNNEIHYRSVCFCKMLKISLLALVILFISLVFKDFLFEYKWHKLVRLSSLGKTEQIIGDYIILNDNWNHNPLFLYNYGVVLSRVHKYSESISVLKQCEKYYNDYDVQLLIANNYLDLDLLILAEKHYLMAHNMIPHKFIPLSKLLQIYKMTNNQSKAVSIANEIVSKEVKIKSITTFRIIKEANNFLDTHASVNDLLIK